MGLDRPREAMLRGVSSSAGGAGDHRQSFCTMV